MGRHSRAVLKRPGWHWRSRSAATSAQRRPGIELTDARTRVVHRVGSAELMAGHRRGKYQALCGARLLAASLTDPSRSWCRKCTW